MSLRFNCPNCEKEIIVKYITVGESAKCLHCGQSITVPANATQTNEEPGYLIKEQDEKLKSRKSINKLKYRDINLKNIKFSSKNTLIAASLILWLSVIIFIIYLYTIYLPNSPLWKYRNLISYGFMVIGGVTAGFIGEKNMAAYIVVVITYGCFSFSNYMWNGIVFSLHNWRILIVGLGFILGKFILYVAEGKIKLKNEKILRSKDIQSADLTLTKKLIPYVILTWFVCILIIQLLTFIDLSDTPLMGIREIFLIVFLVSGGFCGGIFDVKKVYLVTLLLTFGSSRLAYLIWHHSLISNLGWHAIIIIIAFIIGKLVLYKLMKRADETGSKVKPPTFDS